MQGIATDEIWNTLKTIKVKWRNNLKYYMQKACYGGLYTMYDYFNQQFEKAVKINSTLAKTKTSFNVYLPENKLESLAKMFLYLNSCPGHLKAWVTFYNNLFGSKPPDEIVLTLNRILKSDKWPLTKDSKVIARNLLDKVTTLFSLKYKVNNKTLENNHPVHFVNKDGKLSPSAFIPFCAFGRNISTMGIKINQFGIPVCSTFQAKILNDQLCYEVDLKRLSNKENIKHELKSGFAFIMDYNEDRQVKKKEKMIAMDNKKKFMKILMELNNNDHANIYLSTIGKYLGFSTCDFHFKYFEIIEPVELQGEGRYNLNDMKEIMVTDSYLDLDQTVRACQNKESLHSCSTRLHTAAFLAQCGCVPFNMTHAETPLCSGAQLDCVQNTTVDTSTCLPPCSGLFVTGFSKSEQGTDSLQLDRATLKAYRNYTKWSAFPSELKGR